MRGYALPSARHRRAFVAWGTGPPTHFPLVDLNNRAAVIAALLLLEGPSGIGMCRIETGMTRDSQSRRYETAQARWYRPDPT